MTKMLTEEQVRDKLKLVAKRVKQEYLAEILGVSRTYVNRVIHNECGIGPKMASRLGLQQKAVYLMTDNTLDKLLEDSENG